MFRTLIIAKIYSYTEYSDEVFQKMQLIVAFTE